MAEITFTAGDLDPTDFMAGVALFDELLGDARRIAIADGNSGVQDSMALDGRIRDGAPLTLYAMPCIETLQLRPELACGFAGALGDYIGCLAHGVAPNPGAQYTTLTFEDCLRIVPSPPPSPSPSNVVAFRHTGAR